MSSLSQEETKTNNTSTNKRNFSQFDLVLGPLKADPNIIEDSQLEEQNYEGDYIQIKVERNSTISVKHF